MLLVHGWEGQGRKIAAFCRRSSPPASAGGLDCRSTAPRPAAAPLRSTRAAHQRRGRADGPRRAVVAHSIGGAATVSPAPGAAGGAGGPPRDRTSRGVRRDRAHGIGFRGAAAARVVEGPRRDRRRVEDWSVRGCCRTGPDVARPPRPRRREVPFEHGRRLAAAWPGHDSSASRGSGTCGGCAIRG